MATGVIAGGSAQAQTRPVWRDGNRYLWIFGAFVPLFLFAGWGMVAWTGLSVFWWMGPLLIFGVIPVLDLVVGTDTTNPPEEVVPFLEQDRWYRWITYLYLPLQYLSLFAGFWLITQHGGLTWVDKLGVTLTMGGMTGIAVNTAHELGHKKDWVERWLARIALAPSFYGHFYVEHNRGHHVRVATPDDPASSRVGESYWMFLPRTAIGGIRSAWGLERNRLRRQGRGPWSLRNQALSAWLLSGVLLGILVAVFGPEVIGWFFIQAAFGSLLLFEAVNYLEHYGLARQRAEDGRWESVKPEHSWNSNNRVTNILLYHLQRHSDHHANPTRRYQALRHFEEAPQLPSGYAGMILLAYIPPLWRAVMDRRVLAHYGGDMSRANISPRKRTKVLTAYPPA